MSIPLRDFRLGIPDGVHAALEARAIAEGTDMQTVAREVLTSFARREHRAYIIYAKRAAASGMQPELFGDDTEDDGAARSGRR
jgi:plasmid stability protein